MKISILEKILGRCIPKYRKFFFFSEILADFFLYMFFPGISVISITLALGKRVPFFWPCSQHVEVLQARDLTFATAATQTATGTMPDL